ncbi:MAG: peptide ABC transporter permease [Methylophaga sp.]|nr:MAG: peptide ABC transporter permease [Methylophaga sp.]
MKLLKIALKSACNRKVSLSLTMFSIAISIVLLLGVDTIRKQAKNNFINTISQTDLIVGARTSPINLLLYSIFHIGNATNNVSYASYKQIAALKQVKWSVPISLGDSHRGFRVMGTNSDYFRYYRHSNTQSLHFQQGVEFSDVYDAVVGFDVAQSLNYQLNTQIVLNHGIVATKYSEHDDKPFRIVGILKKTNTPVDRTVLVSLQGIEAIHVDWQSGKRSALKISAKKARQMGLEPKSITAFMLGVESKITLFSLQRKINNHPNEPLQAIMPGSTLASLWQTMGQFEKVLMAVSVLVLFTGLMGLLTALLTTLNERRREMAVLRAVGAHAYHIIVLFVLEAILVVMGGFLFGIAMLYAMQAIMQPILADSYGIFLSLKMLDGEQIIILLVALLLAIILSLIPGLIAYKRSLQDGLMVKI